MTKKQLEQLDQINKQLHFRIEKLEGQLEHVHKKYDQKIIEIKTFFEERIDEFLRAKADEFYYQAREHILIKTEMVEHKVALDKIVDGARGLIKEDKELLEAFNVKYK